jgi:hypothetical protein
MSTMTIILIGFMSGLTTMAIINFYKWALKYWHEGFK